jgi:hypothetical protein
MHIFVIYIFNLVRATRSGITFTMYGKGRKTTLGTRKPKALISIPKFIYVTSCYIVVQYFLVLNIQ